MKNILVTGGCGFIGSSFIRYLFGEAGFTGKIVNLDLLTYAANPQSLNDIAAEKGDDYVFCHGSICDDTFVTKVIEDHAIDTIVHFAAESHVDRSIHSPDDFIMTNIIGTYRLLEIVRRKQDQISLFHHVSTDEVFGSLGKDGLFSETTSYKPNSPYSASKASSDHLVRAYHKTYNLPVTISNCSNNYGPFQFPEKLIPLMILNARDGKPLPVYGDGKQVRDWLYVTDHCVAIWDIMQAKRLGETYNVGGKNEMENITVVETIADILDELVGVEGEPRRSLITFVTDRPGHDRRYAIDCSKIEKDLGWEPRETFETGLRKTIQWYLDNAEWVAQVQSGEYRDWIEKQYGLTGTES